MGKLSLERNLFRLLIRMEFVLLMILMVKLRQIRMNSSGVVIAFNCHNTQEIKREIKVMLLSKLRSRVDDHFKDYDSLDFHLL